MRNVRGKISYSFLFCTVGVVLTGAASAGEPCGYLGPSKVTASPDGKRLFVACADARQVAFLNSDGTITRRVDLPARPTGLARAPDGATLYVTCADPRGSVVLLDAVTGEVTGRIGAGHWATGPAVSPDGRRLYVCNRFDNDLSVLDPESGKQLARVPAGREPVASALTPDGKLLVVANLLPSGRADRYGVSAVAAAVTLVDTRTNRSTSVGLTTGSSSVRDVCISPDGRYAYLVHILARYHLPTVQLERGWMNTNALSVIDLTTRRLVNTVLLDEPGHGAANPRGVASTADGRYICVAHAGTHELSVIDAAGLLKRLLSMPASGYSNAAIYGEPYYDYEYGAYPPTSSADVANSLSFLVGLRRRVKLPGNGPRGLVVRGTKVYLAEYFSDTLAVVDLAAGRDASTGSIALGPKPILPVTRRGQMHFNDAAFCYQHWQSCASCHPDGRVDGLNWDLLNDGTDNPKNVRSMLLAHKTPPSMASGVRPDAEAAVRSGIEHIQLCTRPDEDARAIDEYLKTLQPVPSPRLVDGRPSESARRGEKLFFDESVGCSKCHPAPLYTDLPFSTTWAAAHTATAARTSTHPP